MCLRNHHHFELGQRGGGIEDYRGTGDSDGDRGPTRAALHSPRPRLTQVQTLRPAASQGLLGQSRRRPYVL